MATSKKKTAKNRDGWKLGDRCIAGAKGANGANPATKGMICWLSQDGATAKVQWEGNANQHNVETAELLRPSQKGQRRREWDNPKAALAWAMDSTEEPLP